MCFLYLCYPHSSTSKDHPYRTCKKNSDCGSLGAREGGDGGDGRCAIHHNTRRGIKGICFPPRWAATSQSQSQSDCCQWARLYWGRAGLGLAGPASEAFRPYSSADLSSPLLSSPPSTDLVLSTEKLNRLTGSCFPNENEFDFNTKHLTGSLVISPCPQQLQERTAGNCFMFYLCVLCALCYLDWKSFIIELLNLIQTLYYVGLRFLLLRTIHQVYPSSLVTTERKMLSYLKENPSLSERILISYEIKPPPTHKGQHIEY